MIKKIKEENQPKKMRIAKRDFILFCNEHHFEIKKGDDLDVLGVPEFFNQNLKTEEVL